MSKKTRKKSPKTTTTKATRKAIGKTTSKTTRARSATATKTPAAKTRRAVATKPAAKAAKRLGNATPKASHQAASKPLKSSTSKVAAAKSNAAKPRIAEIKVATPTVTKPKVAESKIAASRIAKSPASLAEGAKAPAFHLPRDGGTTVSLADFAGQKLVLFFYPRADTPGCTKEAIDFTRLAGAFAEAGTKVVGVSADPMKAQESFRNKHQLSIPLASDEQHEMLEAYGAWGEKSMYGKTFLGVIRTTVLIGSDSRIARVWRHVKVDGHADEVLAAAKVT